MIGGASDLFGDVRSHSWHSRARLYVQLQRRVFWAFLAFLCRYVEEVERILTNAIRT